jgi:hypothetical protein
MQTEDVSAMFRTPMKPSAPSKRTFAEIVSVPSLSGPCIIQRKYDGVRVQIVANAEKVLIYTSHHGKQLCSSTLAQELREEINRVLDLRVSSQTFVICNFF